MGAAEATIGQFETGLPTRRVYLETFSNAQLVAAQKLPQMNPSKQLANTYTITQWGTRWDYRIATVTTGVTTITHTEATRNAFYNCMIAAITVRSKALGTVINQLSAAQLRRIQQANGIKALSDTEPGLNQAMATSATSQHDGFIDFAWIGELPNDTFRHAYCPSRRQFDEGALNITLGSLAFTDGAGIAWTVTVNSTNVRHYMEYFENPVMVEAKPLVYDMITSNEKANIQLREGMYLSLELHPGDTIKTPVSFGELSNSGVSLWFDGCEKRTMIYDTAVTLSSFVERNYGYSNPYTNEFPAGFRRMDMIGIPLLNTRSEGLRLGSICGGSNVVVSLQQDTAYDAPRDFEMLIVPYEVPECICANGKPAVPAGMGSMNIPPVVARTLPVKEMATSLGAQ